MMLVSLLNLLISVTPSLDTPVCDLQGKRFNEEASKLSKDVVVINVSLDLPFAQARWATASHCGNMHTYSDYKERSFGKAYGVLIDELKLLARSVFVIGPDRKIRYIEYVHEVTDFPNYDKAFKAI